MRHADDDVAFREERAGGAIAQPAQPAAAAPSNLAAAGTGAVTWASDLPHKKESSTNSSTDGASVENRDGAATMIQIGSTKRGLGAPQDGAGAASEMREDETINLESPHATPSRGPPIAAVMPANTSDNSVLPSQIPSAGQWRRSQSLDSISFSIATSTTTSDAEKQEEGDTAEDADKQQQCEQDREALTAATAAFAAATEEVHSSHLPDSMESAAARVANAAGAAATAAATLSRSSDPPLWCDDNGDPGSPKALSIRPRQLLVSESRHSSPTAVTLWGVHRDLRRKRIKKVSHYILGPLLGEGTYGVVRDCIDINTDNVNRRFQRCAIKIVNGDYARFDMPAVFGSRGNSSGKHHNDNNNNACVVSQTVEGDTEEEPTRPTPSLATSSPLNSTAANTSLHTGGTLRRTSGFRQHTSSRTVNRNPSAEAEQRRHGGFEREMRNLQRFHCKNIVRALDSFTRYGKEYVVLPIAICSLQQLVRQLLRTRWREAVRDWKRRQWKLLREQSSQQYRASHGNLDATVGGTTSCDYVRAHAPPPLPGQQQPRSLSTAGNAPSALYLAGGRLPMVPSSACMLDLDDLSFMQDEEGEEEEEEGYFDDEEPDLSERASEGAVEDAETYSNHSAAPQVPAGRSAAANTTRKSRAAMLSRTPATGHDDDQYSNASMSDRDDDREGDPRHGHHYHHGHNNNNNDNGRRRWMPRVNSSGSSSSSTTRTIDSYANEHHYQNTSTNMSSRCHHRTGQGQMPANRHGFLHNADGGEEERSDDRSSSNAASGNASRVTVVSATPTQAKASPLPQGGPQARLVSAPLRLSAVLLEDTTAAVGAVPPPPTGTVKPPRPNSLDHAPPHDDHRPHLTYPMCSTTLLKGILYQAISGVDYLHRQGLAHNDIKPSNVLLFEDGTVKLGDLGSVSETYNDQGTPLFASPELCKYFYGAVTPPSSFAESTAQVGQRAAQPSDMWCCGLLLYYLITGKPGPLPVQLRYFQALHSKRQKEEEGEGEGVETEDAEATPTKREASAALVPPIVTRYQLYREMAAQSKPVNLSDLPDMIPPDFAEDAAVSPPSQSTATEAATGNWPYPPNSVRHLLAGLLEFDPLRRLTAEQALRHPWLRMTFRSKPSDRPDSENTGSPGNATPSKDGAAAVHEQLAQKKTPSKQAMEDAIQRDVGRRVTESRHVQRMLKLDRQRHLQFVADCCNMLNLTIPPEIVKVQPAEPYREDPHGGSTANRSSNTHQHLLPGSNTGSNTASIASLAIALRNATPQQQRDAVTAMAAAMVQNSRRRSNGSNNTRSSTGAAGANDGTSSSVKEAMMPAAMPPGCVDTELFLPHTEEDYYEQKSGKSEFDVRVLRRKPLLLAQFDEYFHNVVLVQCGYRTGPDPNYQAMRVRVVPMEEEGGSGSRRGRTSASGSQRATQQPSVVILPGASNNVYRRSPSVGLARVAMDAGATDFAALTGASEGVVAEDVWGAGPRHLPRTHAEDNRPSSGAASPAATTPATGTTSVQAIDVTARTTASSAPAASSASPSAAAGSPGSNAGSRPGSGARTSGREASASSTPFPAASNAPTSNNSNNAGARRSGNNSTRPSVSVSVSGRNSNNSNDEVLGIAVVNTARVSSQSSQSRRGAAPSPREGSETPSEAEANMAMRESSKCLCGLM